MKTITVSKKLEKKIIKEYLSGIPSTVLAKKYKYDKSTIRRVLIRNNIPRRNPSNARHKNSRWINKYGYVRVTPRIEEKHLNPTTAVAMQEHRLIMARHLGRALYKHEVVHHKNGNRSDNRIENLELWSKSQPYGQRVLDKIKWAQELLEQYGYKVLKI